jgi:hypothetical protein
MRSAIALTMDRPRPEPSCYAVGDRPDDGQAQARAELFAAQHAIERVEHALTVSRRDARSGVAHAQHDIAVGHARRQVDLAAGRRIADRIVDQVLHQREHVELAARHLRVHGPVDPDVDPLDVGEGHEVFQHAAEHVLQRYRGLPDPGVGLRPGEAQQLVQQASAAFDPLAQQDESFARYGGQVGVGQALGLQRQGGERRAQFMRRVRDEAALRCHGAFHASEQAVDRHGERSDFAGEMPVFDRMQLAFVALVDFPGQHGDRPEQLAHEVGDDEQQHRHQDE